MHDVIEVELEFSIKPYNIDAAGHVNNAVYINWLEDLRTKLLDKIILRNVMIERNYHLVVASTNIQYKKPLHLYEQPVGKMKIDKYEKGVLYLSSVIMLDKIIIAKAFQKCVFFDKGIKKMVNAEKVLLTIP